MTHNSTLIFSILWSVSFCIGYPPLAKGQGGSISGVKFNDVNGDAIRNNPADEPGLSGWTITARKQADTLFFTAANTNANGEYTIGGLADGTYIVRENQQSGWQQTVPPGGAYTVQISGGSSESGKDFGNIATSSLVHIAGLKFHDLNSNGIQDAGEPGLSGWQINLTGTATATRTTNQNGTFSFTNLLPGTYTVSEAEQSGWVQTYPTVPGTYIVSLSPSQDFDGAVFGNYFTVGTVTGTVFMDLNGDGIRETADTLESFEPVLPNWTVELSGPQLGTTMTNANGVYTFTNLPDEVYTIGAATPDGWTQTLPVPPGTYAVTISSGSRTILGKDFGYRGSGTISGKAFNDLNSNCNQDLPAEIGLDGRSVSVVHLPGYPSFSRLLTTDANGDYSLSNLPLGSYEVRQYVQVNWVKTCPVNPDYYSVQLTLGQPSASNLDFGSRLIGGSISGKIYLKLDGVFSDTGLISPVPVAGKTIFLTGSTNLSTTTDGSGRYEFSELPDGDYTISQEAVAGWEQLNPPAPGTYSATISSLIRTITGKNFLDRGTASINGMAFDDVNQINCLDAGESGQPNWRIRLVSNTLALGPLYVDTDGDGNYTYQHFPPGQYTISEVSKPLWSLTCPSGNGNYNVQLNPNDQVTGKDFGNIASVSVQNVRLSLAGGVARPGFQTDYSIRYENIGTETVTATIIFVHPEHTTYLPDQSFPPHDSYDPQTRTVTWNVGSLVAEFVGTIHVKAQIANPPEVNNGDLLISSCHIDPVSGDANPGDNDATETQQVRGSFDPNEKLADPSGDGQMTSIPAGTTIHYRINFQNTGTDTAFNIMMRDTLDGDLDPITFISGASSNPYILTVRNDSEFTWSFSHILLPDSNVDEAGSHGFVKFDVRLRSDVAVGSLIYNRAGIYFDFNPPVLTNTVIHLVGNVLAVEATKNWNMLSVPLLVGSYLKTNVFPTATSSAIAYKGVYVQRDTLVNGVGYWLKFPEEKNVTMMGSPIVAETIYVVQGWNMIGSLSSPLSTLAVSFLSTTRKSFFFNYRGQYYTTDTIEPGKGYWVKVSSAGTIVLSSSASIAKVSATESADNDLGNFNMLLITDANDYRQMLYFGKKPSETFDPDLYELPPTWREGEFDARFASQRMSEVYPEKLEKPQQFEIDITSAAYPLAIHWELAKGNKNKFTLTDVQEGKLFGSVALNEKGELKIIDPKVTKLVLKVQSGRRIPTEFALRQNYPNPFNPSAIIEFDLPRDASVTLKIYDILGREVTTVKDNEQYEAGTYQVQFEASAFASGVYFYRISAQNEGKTFVDVKKMLLLR